MATYVRGISQRRRDGHAGLRPVHGHAFAIVTVASEAEFAVDGLSAGELVVLLLGVVLAADGVVTGQHDGTKLLHALGGVGHEGLLDELGAIGPSLDVIRAQELRRHQELEHDGGVLVGGELTEFSDEGLVARPDERLAGAEALRPQTGIGVGQEGGHDLGVERTEAFQGPQRVDAAEGVLAVEG